VLIQNCLISYSQQLFLGAFSSPPCLEEVIVRDCVDIGGRKLWKEESNEDIRFRAFKMEGYGLSRRVRWKKRIPLELEVARGPPNPERHMWQRVRAS
jgi:hypothetical protein